MNENSAPHRLINAYLLKEVDEVAGIVKKASADFSLLSVRKPYIFFANHGLGLRHAFSVSVIFLVTCDVLDPL